MVVHYSLTFQMSCTQMLNNVAEIKMLFKNAYRIVTILIQTPISECLVNAPNSPQK